MTVAIRRAAAADAEALTALARSAKASWGYPQAWLDAWAPDLTISAGYVERHPVFVAAAGTAPAGVVAIEIDGGTAEIGHLWVAPDQQRRGIGAALVGAALRAARGAGCHRVRVVSDPHAWPFYERLGARRTGDVAAPMPGAPDRTLPELSFVLDPF